MSSIGFVVIAYSCFIMFGRRRKNGVVVVHVMRERECAQNNVRLHKESSFSFPLRELVKYIPIFPSYVPQKFSLGLKKKKREEKRRI